MTRHPFPWVALAAYTVLWFAPRINRWLDQPPRPDRPTPSQPMDQGPGRWTIERRGPGRELDRPGGGS